MKQSLLGFRIVAGALLAFSPALVSANSLLEFTPDEVRSLGWRVVDDGVMGGKSKGGMEVSRDGVLTFSGKLSLENNGGFSSIRSARVKKNLSAADGLLARVKGDGRTYQVRFNTDARFRGMEVSFKADFKTKKGKWTEVKIPFASFTGSFRGMELKKKEFDPAKIQRLGLLLADKKPGQFEVKVDWIRTYGADPEDLVSTALGDGRFGTLARVLTEAKLVKTLQGDGPFTVFAPTDEAFATLPKATLASLLKPENRGKLQSILTYHVIAGSVDLAGALAAGEAATVQGSSVKISFSDGRVHVNEAGLVNADIKCSNGIIHVIDSVILPPEPANDLASVAKRAGKFKTLLAAVTAVGLGEALTGDKPLTVFAPTDEAFAALPKGTVETLLKPENKERLKSILALHVVPGKVSAGDALNAGKAKALSGGTLKFGISDGLFKVNGATIKVTDLQCDNGVIHSIDAVLLPSSNDSKKSSPKTARQQIEEAVSKGVPIFNKGDHRKCAKIYRDCMTSISARAELDERIGKAVTGLIKRSDKIEDETERAWLLRSGLDHLYAILSDQ